jgi:hypothetical protein
MYFFIKKQKKYFLTSSTIQICNSFKKGKKNLYISKYI